MAEIKMERKESGGMGWLWILIALILLALLAWWLWPEAEVEEPLVTTTELETIEPLPEPVAEAPGVTLSEIIASPATYTGQTFGGEVRVTEVPTDRGFWIEDQGVRLFALINDQPRERPAHIQEGTSIRIQEAVVRDATFLTAIPGAPLDADTERILQEQDVFLTVDEEDVQMLNEAAATN